MSIIYGKRIRLRSAERSDLERFIEWINDPEVTAGLTLFLPMSSVDEEKKPAVDLKNLTETTACA